MHDIRTKIPLTAITASDFESKIEALSSDRAKAPEREHALRHHISQNLDQDPEHYGRLSERFDEILTRLDGNRAAMYEAFPDLHADVKEGRQAGRRHRPGPQHRSALLRPDRHDHAGRGYGGRPATWSVTFNR